MGLTSKDVLNQAIKLEEDGVAFYKDLYEMCSDDYRKQIIISLIEEEREHTKIFKEIASKINYIAKLDLNVKSISEFILPDTKDFNVNKSSFREIIKFALSQEYRSIEYYLKMLQDIVDEDDNKLVDNIIKEEEKHVTKLSEMIYYENTNISIEKHDSFIDALINNMEDFVQVIDTDYNVIFANHSMNKEFGNYIVGRKCYEVFGKEKPCDLCKRKKDGDNSIEKKFIELNNKTYSVICSPIENISNNSELYIEVFRDVTKEKILRKQIEYQNEKFMNDLIAARKVQNILLPKNIESKNFEFDYYFKPCEKIGGDLLDIYRIDEKHIGVYISDVAGHGIPTALVSMFLSQNIDKAELSPSKVLKKLSKNFKKLNFDEEMYITIFYCVIDLLKMKITYSNAGHNVVPFIFNEKDEEIYELEAKGVPISNWFEDTNYEEKHLMICKEDVIFMTTDGLIELKDSKKDSFDIDKLYKIVSNNKNREIIKIKKLIKDEIKKYDKPKDDISYMLVKIK